MRQLSLNSGPWRFRDVTAKGPWRPATVPGCVHTDLHRLGEIPDPFWGTNELGLQWIEERDWEYAAKLDVPTELLEEEVVELVADGLDTVATVLLNGHRVARTENMFIGYRWNVKKLLRPGTNEITVRFDSAMGYIRTHRRAHAPHEFNDPVGRSQVLRKQQCQFGWDWGPRFVTAGIWRDLRLEGWTRNRLVGVRITQDHATKGSVTLQLSPELARTDRRATCHYRLKLGNVVVAEGDGDTVHVDQPQLWWPNGHGAQPLYALTVEVRHSDGRSIGTRTQRVGLRTIELDRHADKAGETFQFKVNGRAIFAKGANWIPAHAFVASLTRTDYARDLHSATAAHMNMLRVWGGGIYESEDFYDLCDELGLLVWQDFMFACAIYPGDRAFVRSAAAEAECQVRRLRHRACLALWCGNNEIEALNKDPMQGGRLTDPANSAAYTALFDRALPEVVAQLDGTTPYWPSSPHRPDNTIKHADGEKHGDTHYWDVWHARHPVKDYEKWKFRFVSEFGMQSYCSPETQATFCPTDERNIFGAAMENHQKNRGGNQVILDYVSRRYRFPRTQDDLVYLSQLNQAYCMQTGVEHYRRLMPHCMGALYWQLNDCWPVASWSSIEFTGRWRALHFVARRFFAPALVTAHVPGDEVAGIGNYRRSTVREVHVYTVYDAPQPARGTLRWDLFHLDGTIVQRSRKDIALAYGESTRHHTIDLASALAKHGRESLYLRLSLEVEGRLASEDTVFLTPPRFMNLPRPRTNVAIDLVTPTKAQLRFTSPVFQHRFAFDLPGLNPQASDNYFELYPNESRTVTVDFNRPVTRAQLREKLVWRSLADTY